jgi:NAD(P)-dependent dehydrogenase (short-subunit alcohol dehydrogenase family)
MKILITGGTGFIGSYVVEALLNRGEEVVIFNRLNNKTKTYIEKNYTTKNLTVINGDITDADSTIESISIHCPDVVIHLAAITGIKNCLDNPKESFNVNVYGTFNVVRACVKTGSRLIFASSREVYGETIGSATAEDDPTLPNNIYGITKLLGELEKDIKEKLREYKLESNVILLFKDGVEKLNIQGKQDVIHPAVYDTGAIAPMEAMSCGLPVVMFDLPALRTYYPKGVIKVPKNNLRLFAESIIDLLFDVKLYETLKKEAIQLTRELDWNKKAHELSNLIRKVLDDGYR